MENSIRPTRQFVTLPKPSGVCSAAAFVLAGALITDSAFAQAPALPLPTPAEAADYLAFTSADAVAPYLQRVAAASEGIEVGSLPGADGIPVIRIAAEATDVVGAGAGGAADATSADVVRVLVVGAQHGDERAGLEVGLRLARDLATGPLAPLRARLEVRIVPMANPGGVRDRERLTPGGIDMNRDHVRLADPATRALWREFTAWRPHLVLDLHEIGPSEFSVQIGLPTHPNVDPGLVVVGRYYMLPHAAKALARADIRFHEYVAPWSDGESSEIAASPADPTDAAISWYTPPPTESASARNAFALAGSLAFLVETASSRDVLGLEQRTDRMYLASVALLSVAATLPTDVIDASERATASPGGSLALRSRYVEKAQGVRLPWVFTNERGQLEQGYLAPWRSDLQIDAELAQPAGWWILGEPDGLVEALESHGFRVAEAGAPPAARWYEYPRCGDVSAGWPPSPRPIAEPRVEPNGRWLSADQPGARLLFSIVEPWSTGGWFEDPAAEAGADCTGSGEAPADSRFPVLRAER